MDSKEIIESISVIYERFQTMLNLEMHMRRVASVGQSIASTWNSPIAIYQDDIVAAYIPYKSERPQGTP